MPVPVVDVEGAGAGKYRGGDAHFDDVHYSYDGERPALAGVTLNVRPGEYLAIIGSNGSGKSTLAKHVNALCIPDSGRVVIEGIDTGDPDNVYDVRSRVGMVFQNPENQMVTSIVADDVAFGPENLGVSREEIIQRVAAALAAVGMEDLARTEFANLSGGQKQRIAIAGILAMEPDILVLDEPGAMLDPRGRRGIRRVSHQLSEHGMTVMLITHFMEEALAADRVLVVSEGRVAMEGTPDQVFTQGDRLRELRLDVPMVVKLSEALRARGIDVPDTLDEETLEVELCRLFSNM
ncbi:MAG: energy-coupling factor transporter ATPase [Coriobacteriia bacterium]|nr:energy-coupling factor transporter ATPase [Coriobacteriia bacterium]